MDSTSGAAFSANLVMRGLAANASAMVLLDNQLRVSFANEGAQKTWKLGIAEISGCAIAELLTDSEQTAGFLDALSRKGAWSGELTARIKDGSRADLLVKANAVDDENGNPYGYLCIFFDVGDRRDELRRLQNVHKMFSNIGEQSKFIVFETIPEEGIFRIVGDRPLMPLGPNENVRGDRNALIDMYVPEDRAEIEAATEFILSGGESHGYIDSRAVLPDGTTRWIRTDGYLASSPGEKPGRIVGWSRDVTEEKEALLELESLKKRYTLAADFSKTMVFELIPQEGKLLASGNVRLMPISEDDWGEGSMDARMALFHPEDANDMRQLVGSIIQGNADSGEIEARVPYPDGSTHWLCLEFHVADRSEEGPIRIVGIGRDITEQKDAEIALRASEQRYALAAKFGRMAAWEIYPDEGEILADENLAALLGQPDTAPSTDLEVWNDTIYPADREYVEREMREVIEGRANSFTIEHRTIMSDGSIEWRRDEGHVASKPGEPLRIIGTSLDVTAQRLAEEQLRQAQKMETVGQLAAGVAHDFNNLLAVVLGNVELAMEDVSGNPELSELLEQALIAGERGAELTRHLLAFSRRQTLYPEAVDLDSVLGHFIPLLKRAIGWGVDVVYRPNTDLKQVFIDRSQLESGILNLVLNARDAMPNGGTVTISAKNITRSNEDGGVSSGSDFVCVEVADTGVGMDEDVLAEAFAPFFTTKSVGKGSGLGLSMVQGFAEQSGGHVELESAPGQGTSVKLYLPVNTQGNVSGVRRRRSGVRRTGKVYTVLIVDDDEHVRDVVSKQVRSLGYEVSQARNAEDALSILESDQAIALLLTDVVLGSGMDGIALAIEAKCRFPSLETLCMSGHAESDILDGYDEAAHLAIIPKPFTKAQLSEQIEGALSGSSGAEAPPA